MTVKDLKNGVMAIHAQIQNLIKAREEIDLTIKGLKALIPDTPASKRQMYVLRNNGGKPEITEVGHRRNSGKNRER